MTTDLRWTRYVRFTSDSDSNNDLPRSHLGPKAVIPLAPELLRAMLDVGYFPPNTPPTPH